MLDTKPQSYEEIYNSMIKTLSVHGPCGLDPRPGTVMATIIGMVAEQVYILQHQILQLQMNAVQTWIYPDGTRSTNRPKPGEKFTLHTDPYNSDEFIWDDGKQQWSRVAHSSIVKLEQPIEFIPLTISIEGEKCNCGSEKVGSPRHSSWCDKYDPNQ